MSWLFSRALVEGFSEGTSWAGELCAPSNGSPTPQAFCAPDRTTAFSRPSRFGMTFKPLTADRGEELLMSYLAAFPARTSASLAKARDSMGNDQECGGTWRGWLAKFDPATSSWRTAQCSLLEDLTESLVTLPRSGMTRSGLLWERQTLELRTREIASGLWATPTASDGQRGGMLTENMTGISIAQQVKTPQRWPTPLASDAESAGGISCWQRGKRGLSLNTAVRLMYPTPGYNDYKIGKGYDHGSKKQTPQLRHMSGGLLNPTWVEWLMGWPLGWTDLKPLATAKCHSALQPHGDCLEGL